MDKTPRPCGHDSPLTPILKTCYECLQEHMRGIAEEKAREEAHYFGGVSDTNHDSQGTV